MAVMDLAFKLGDCLGRSFLSLTNTTFGILDLENLIYTKERLHE